MSQPNGYDHEKLAILARVLHEALAETVSSNSGLIGDAETQQLATRLGKVIMDRFTAGETDPEALTRAAVELVLQGRMIDDLSQ